MFTTTLRRNTRWTLAALAAGLLHSIAASAAEGWFHWRGPNQNGTSEETGLPESLGEPIWVDEMSGRGAPVIAGDRLYSWGYTGTGSDLREFLSCLDPESGKVHWRIPFSDFLSDTVYSRYSIGAPTVDPETGNVFIMSTANEFACVSPDGQILWIVSCTERFGALSFPNGRRGAPIVDGDLVIHHMVNSYWGAAGPARDRFLAFDKHTGELVWMSTPGTAPKDSSFSSPVLGYANGKRVLYAGTGCGNLVCVNVANGEPVWRYHLSKGGVNSSVLLHDDNKLIAISGKENVDDSGTGRMVAVKTGLEGPEQVVLTKDDELWRNDDLSMFTSSPVLVGDQVFQVTHTGELACIDANTGEIRYTYKLGTSQLHASPLFADGKLYVPMQDGNFHILKVDADSVSPLSVQELEGALLGAPVAYKGKIYVHTQSKLYCFGETREDASEAPDWPVAEPAVAGASEGFQIIPSDFLLSPGQSQEFRVSSVDGNGFSVDSLDPSSLEWASFVPPTAKVITRMEGAFNEDGVLVAGASPFSSAGAFKAKGDLGATVVRGRVLPAIPFEENFERFDRVESYPAGHVHGGIEFAYPPLAWIGARFKWDIREMEGSAVLAKTLDNVLFQRAITFFGDPNSKDYEMVADVMTDGNRRMRSNIGFIHQRYFIYLVGNAQILEVSSNQERLKESVRFRWNPGEWYRLKTRVEITDDGSGRIMAKAWPKAGPEPDAWTLEIEHKHAHRHGAPGLIGFSPQARYSVYVDNLAVQPID